jgi:hypothetical protein
MIDNNPDIIDTVLDHIGTKLIEGLDKNNKGNLEVD